MSFAQRCGRALAAKLRVFGAETIISPAMGALIVGQEVARQLNLRFIFAEKEGDRLALRRFRIGSGEKIIIVEDVIRRGARVQETINIVRSNGGMLLAVAMLADETGGKLNLGIPMFSL